jgi:hypothetical protein
MGTQPLPHFGAAHRLADRRRVDLVVLVALAIALHVLRRDQHHLVAQFAQLTRPVMRSATGFQADRGRIQLGHERQELAASQLFAQHHLLLLVDAMKLEGALRRVDADSC